MNLYINLDSGDAKPKDIIYCLFGSSIGQSSGYSIENIRLENGEISDNNFFGSLLGRFHNSSAWSINIINLKFIGEFTVNGTSGGGAVGSVSDSTMSEAYNYGNITMGSGQGAIGAHDTGSNPSIDIQGESISSLRYPTAASDNSCATIESYSNWSTCTDSEANPYGDYGANQE